MWNVANIKINYSKEIRLIVYVCLEGDCSLRFGALLMQEVILIRTKMKSCKYQKKTIWLETKLLWKQDANEYVKVEECVHL